MPNPERAPRSETRIDYTIRPLLNGVCTIAGNHAFAGGDPEERYPYALLVWLVEGGPRPMLVDAGLCDVAEMNRGARHVLAEPITQSPEQRVEAQLAGFGYSPADVGAVFITHLHFDHVDELPRFENAGLYVSARGLAAATQNPGWQGSCTPWTTARSCPVCRSCTSADTAPAARP
jgi:glyoxylase-like metal-dependent hydrolase (beta-lactamase superfamily II)